MAGTGIARPRIFVASLGVGMKGFIIGATATFALGLEAVLVGGVTFASPGAVVQFMAAYPLILLLVLMSGVAGLIFFIRRVHSYQKRFLVFPEARVLPRHAAYPVR